MLSYTLLTQNVQLKDSIIQDNRLLIRDKFRELKDERYRDEFQRTMLFDRLRLLNNFIKKAALIYSRLLFNVYSTENIIQLIYLLNQERSQFYACKAFPYCHEPDLNIYVDRILQVFLQRPYG